MGNSNKNNKAIRNPSDINIHIYNLVNLRVDLETTVQNNLNLKLANHTSIFQISLPL